MELARVGGATKKVILKHLIKSCKYSENIKINRLLQQGVRDGQLWKVAAKKVQKGKKAKKTKGDMNIAPAKYKLVPQSLLNRKDYEHVGTALREVLDQWKTSVDRDPSSFTLEQLRNDLPGRTDISEEQLIDFIQMAQVKQQLTRNRGNLSRLINEPPSIKGLLDAPLTVTDRHKGRSFQRSKCSQLLNDDRLAIPCTFFGCGYTGQASNKVHHYVRKLCKQQCRTKLIYRFLFRAVTSTCSSVATARRSRPTNIRPTEARRLASSISRTYMAIAGRLFWLIGTRSHSCEK